MPTTVDIDAVPKKIVAQLAALGLFAPIAAFFKGASSDERAEMRVAELMQQRFDLMLDQGMNTKRQTRLDAPGLQRALVETSLSDERKTLAEFSEWVSARASFCARR